MKEVEPIKVKIIRFLIFTGATGVNTYPEFAAENILMRRAEMIFFVACGKRLKKGNYRARISIYDKCPELREGLIRFEIDSDDPGKYWKISSMNRISYSFLCKENFLKSTRIAKATMEKAKYLRLEII